MAKRVPVTWRKAGAKKPPGVVYVGRPSRFGNPFKVGEWWIVTDNVMIPVDRARSDAICVRDKQGEK